MAVIEVRLIFTFFFPNSKYACDLKSGEHYKLHIFSRGFYIIENEMHLQLKSNSRMQLQLPIFMINHLISDEYSELIDSILMDKRSHWVNVNFLNFNFIFLKLVRTSLKKVKYEIIFYHYFRRLQKKSYL